MPVGVSPTQGSSGNVALAACFAHAASGVCSSSERVGTCILTPSLSLLLSGMHEFPM